MLYLLSFLCAGRKMSDFANPMYLHIKQRKYSCAKRKSMKGFQRLYNVFTEIITTEITKKKSWEKKEQFTLYSALLTVSFVQLLLSF